MKMHSLESTAGKMCTIGKTLYSKDRKALGENTYTLDINTDKIST